jgi:hypothetical protein
VKKKENQTCQSTKQLPNSTQRSITYVYRKASQRMAARWTPSTFLILRPTPPRASLSLETPWLLQHTLYQYAIQDIVNHWQAIDATQPVSTRLSDRSIVRTFLQTYGLWEVDQPKGVWASMRFFVRFLLAYGQFHFRTEVDRRLRFRASKRFAHRVCTNSLAGEASPKASGLRRFETDAGRGGRMSARCIGSHLRTNEPKSGGRFAC